MKKKTLSLALALVMCLGLIVPSFAAEVTADDTSVTVVDSTGLSITLQLSNPIQGTETLAVGDGGDVTAYTVPAGTTVTPAISGASWTEGIFNGDLLRNSDFVGTLPAGQTWDGEEGVEFACIKQTEDAGSWTEGDYFSGSTTLSDGVLAIVCQHYFGVQDSGDIGIARESSRVYFRVADEAAPTDPEPAPPEDDGYTQGLAYASNQTVTVDGQAVEFQMYALLDDNGNGTNYIKLRDMAHILNGTQAQFSVGYDNASKSISAATGEAYASTGTEMTTPFSGNRAFTGRNQTILIDGEEVTMFVITLLDDNGGGYNYFKLRDLGAALGFNVGWSKEAGVFIETDKPYEG